jgi:hypothetical protein
MLASSVRGAIQSTAPPFFHFGNADLSNAEQHQQNDEADRQAQKP